jgi:hypothetical protein
VSFNIQFAEGGIMRAIQGSGSGGSGAAGAATAGATIATAMTTGGATAAATIGTTMTSAGAAVAAAIAAAMQAGGAGSAAADAISGAALGGDATIPQAALGWAGRVGGWSPPDTHLFMARVAPGETVSIRNPGQMAAAAAAASAQRPTQVHVTNVIDKKDVLAMIMASPEVDRHIVNLVRRMGR